MLSGKPIWKFALRTIAFLLFFFCAVFIYFFFYIGNKPPDKVIWRAVHFAVTKSKAEVPQAKTVVLADSVGGQMYNRQKYNDEIYSLASNIEVSVLGNYVLLNNFLEANPDAGPLKVYLIYRPSSFRTNLDQKLTFNYFLKPLYRDEYKPHFSEFAMRQVRAFPFYWLSEISFIRNSDWAPKHNVPANIHQFKMSELSAEYLKKIQELCKSRNASFEVKATFMSDQFKDETYQEMKKQIEELGLSDLFADYFDDLEYLDTKLFRDEVHLTDESILGVDPKKL